MIRFAVIGTNWISHAFCQAAHTTRLLKLTAVYSRTLETAHAFAEQYAVTDCYDHLEAIADNPDIDAVYIASPNSLHASQAELFLKQGKHVVGEKPLASNIDEVRHLIEIALANNVVLMEAMKTRYLPNLQISREALPSLGKIRRAHFSFCQYSSRYQKYLDGENPNTFNPEFSNGSLMDIGIYPLTAAIELFGKPEQVSASGSLLESGVDAHGSLTLKYEGFEVLVSHSKVSDGLTPSDIQGEAGALLIEQISDCRTVTRIIRGEAPEKLGITQPENTLEYEAKAFAELIQNRQYQHPGLVTTQVISEIMTDARKMLGVVYPADRLS
ncbi:Gfo/Idh/MocA family oxidoreductase [Endozoicomonas gorgoniicola]|uniref:Gfo/Idh/MocA family oxidoreductase n=1 Tax=Endozoicomonas gorgoniicola TaxID=1234144 RepID=A0ABT3MP41_9GAMM|nr:Gfo/Idh/MocA family oxidoreductase [Endozoicomonas gorgoniicola]MCW7551101.1 Gfo/Idh/MocA family oxidoreductase [Endozoicomonas gorgoniicola]